MLLQSDCGFNVGDRVVLIVSNPDGNNELVTGDTGDLMFIGSEDEYGSLWFGVAWDKNIGGHDLRSNVKCHEEIDDKTLESIVCPNGHGWFVTAGHLAVDKDAAFDTASDADVMSLLMG